MSIEESAYGAAAFTDTAFESPVQPADMGYDRNLKSTRGRLRDALAREQVLLREKDAMIHQQETIYDLLGAGADAADLVAGLTPRERQIMDMMLDGHANKVIAADIHLSRRTVEQHRANIMKKTGTKGLAALARLALAAAWMGASEWTVPNEPGLQRAG